MEEINISHLGDDLLEALRLNMSDTSVLLVTPSDSPYARDIGRFGTNNSSENFGNGKYLMLTIPTRRSGSSLFARFQSRLRHILTKLNSEASIGSASGNDKEKIRIKDLLINVPTHEVSRSGQRIKLTLSEFNLLVAMASRNGDILDYITLVRTVLGYEAEETEAKELIKRHIYTLRRKIEPTPSKPRYILNIRGVGYRLAS